MILNEHSIQGNKGKTVCYSLTNFHFDTDDYHLKWDAFKFYTPLGEQTDEEGFHFFEVPSDEVLIQRDDQLDKEFFIMIASGDGVVVMETWEGAQIPPVVIGLEGDVVASGFIPADGDQEIVIDYKEVTNG